MNILNCFQNNYTHWRATHSRFYHMEHHLVPCLLVGNQKGTLLDRVCTFQHSEFDSKKKRAQDLLTFHVCLFILLNNHSGVRLATFLFSSACGLVGIGSGQKENRKILRESTGCDRKRSW